MKSLTSARGFTTRAIDASWRLFLSGAVPQSAHFLTHTQAIADLTLPVYAPAGDWGKGGPPLLWQVGQRDRTGTIHETRPSRRTASRACLRRFREKPSMASQSWCRAAAQDSR